MASANDFMKVFGGVSVVKCPSVSLEGCTFKLLGLQPYREWYTTGEMKPDGTPKWAQSDELVLDDTQEKVRCEVSLLIVDANGLATSVGAPFVDRSCYLSLDEVKKAAALVGGDVKLTAPRVEFREATTESKSGYKRIETRIRFAFDGFEL